MKILDEKYIIDFNTDLLDKSVAKDLVHIIRGNKPITPILYLKNITTEDVTPTDAPANHLQLTAKIIKSSLYRVCNSFPIVENNFIGKEQQEEMIKSTMIREAWFNITKLVTDKIKELSNKTYLNSYNWFERLLNKLYKLFGKKYIKKTCVKTVIDFVNILASRLSKILSNDHFGQAYIICGQRVASFLSGSELFVFANDSSHNRKLNFIGTIYSVKIFVDPYSEYNDNSVYLGLKKENETLTSPNVCLYLQENGTTFEDIDSYVYIDSYVLGRDFTSEPIKKKQLSLRMALFTLEEDNVHELFDKIVLKLPKKNNYERSN